SGRLGHSRAACDDVRLGAGAAGFPREGQPRFLEDAARRGECRGLAGRRLRRIRRELRAHRPRREPPAPAPGLPQHQAVHDRAWRQRFGRAPAQARGRRGAGRIIRRAPGRGTARWGMMADVTGTLEGVPSGWQHTEPARASAPAAARSWSQRLRRALMRSAEAPAADENTAANTRPDPLAIRQRLYGRGYVIPGDAAWLLALVAPFRLGASSALLDLAAGLGGPARTVAQAFHARVTGIERDHDCARQANAMSSALGAA